MIVTFNEVYLENLYKKGETGLKKFRFQPQVVRGYQKAVKYLIQARCKEDLFPFKSLHFEALHGDKEGRFSVKANDQYRVEFTLEESDDEPVVTICNIIELSNLIFILDADCCETLIESENSLDAAADESHANRSSKL